MADQEDYVIESVVAAQAHIVGRKIKWKYRVKWEGYASSENTWEPAGNMNSSGGDDDVLEVFWNKAPLDGRDRQDVRTWKTKDTVWLTDEIAMKDPECPKQPQRYGVTSRPAKKQSTGVTVRDEDASSPPSSPAPSRSQSKRKHVDDAAHASTPASSKRKRPSASQAQTGKALKPVITSGKNRRVSSLSVPDSEDAVPRDESNDDVLEDTENANKHDGVGAEDPWLAFAEQQLNAIGAVNLTKARIDREIGAALRAIAFLKDRSDAVQTGAASMPAEVLEAIFTLLVSHDSPRKGHIGWIRVSHVCSKWRAAAIGTARLWCNIPVDVLDNRWVSAFVQRSGDEPITWEMSKIWTSPYFAPPPRSPLPPRLQTLIQENLNHIAKLRLYLPASTSTPENTKWIRTLGAKAPFLTSLDLDCLFSPPVSLASSMVPFAAPLLSELVLKGISPDLAGVSWSNLLMLNICNAQLDFHPLLAALSSAPKLKELTLRGIYLSSTISNHVHNRVSLSKLQKLDLRSDPRTCIIICKALSVPPIPSYCVDFAGPQISPQSGVDPLIDVISVIRERVRDAYCSERPLYKLEIGQESEDEELWGDLTIQCGDERCDEECELEGDGIMNFFKLPRSPGRFSDENALSLLKSLSLDTCVKMRASGFLLSDGDVWMGILPSLLRVVELEVYLHAGQPFIEAVYELFDDTKLILPRLTWFTLKGANLHEPYEDPPIPIQLLAWVVDRRTRAGVEALHQLQISGCSGLTSRQMDRFYKLEGMDILTDE